MRFNLFLIGLMTFFLHINIQANELIPLKIQVNTADKGEYFVLLAENSDVFVAKEDFAQLGIRLQVKSEKIEGQQYVSLKKAAIQYEIDEKTLTLRLQVDPLLLDKTSLNLAVDAVVKKNILGIDSAYLNYTFVHIGNDTAETFSKFIVPFQKFELPLEAVVSAHDLLFQSTFTYRYNNDVSRDPVDRVYWSRGLTNATKDFRKQLGRLIIGDFIANSNELGGSGFFLGLSYQKKYSMASHFTKFPGLRVDGVLTTPSQVNMYLNDVLIRSENLSAGEYEIDNLPNLYGAGKLRIEIIDAFGRIQNREMPFYVSTRLLRAGLDDFSYGLGYRRDSITVKQPEYDVSPTFLGFHRWGINRFLTMGYRFEFSEEVSNGGIELSTLVGSIGEVDAGISLSRYQWVDAAAGYFRYGFTSKYFHGRYSYKQYEHPYTTISTIESRIRTERLQTASLGVHGLPVGSLSINYSVSDFFEEAQLDNPKIESWTLVYNIRIAQRSSLLFRAVRKVDKDGETDEFIASINTSFGKRISGNVSYNEQEGQNQKSAYLQRSVPLGTGLGYRIRASQKQLTQPTIIEDTEDSLDGSIQLKMKYLSMNILYAKNQNIQSYQTQIGGSLAFVNNDFYLTRPIQDSFGLVKVNKLDGVRVYFSNEEIDRTSDGDLIVPNLISYADNVLSIDPFDIPIDRSLKHTRKTLVPTYRTGVVANFSVDRFQGFSGYIFIVKALQKISADFGDLYLKRAGESFSTVIGRGGEFYFENLNPGKYNAEVKLNGESCFFNIKISESPEMMVELGSYECEI